MGAFGRIVERVSGGSGGRGSGRGTVALPDRNTRGTPPPLPAVAPGGQQGPNALHFGSFFDTLPLRQAPIQDMTAAPSELRYARPRYLNTGGRDGYSAPTQVSWTVNGAIGPGPGAGPGSIPVSIKRHDSMTMRREFGKDAQRYPFEGYGWPRVKPQNLARNRRLYTMRPQMRVSHQNELTRLPSATSFGATTTVVGMPAASQGGSVFG